MTLSLDRAEMAVRLEPEVPVADPLLTVRRLAQIEGLTEEQIRWMVRSGAPHVRAGGIKIRLSEWRAWLAKHRRPPP